MKRTSFVVAALCLYLFCGLAVAAHAAPQPSFLSRAEVATDAEARLGQIPSGLSNAGRGARSHAKGQAPAAANYLSFEGDVVLAYLSTNDWGAIRVGTIDARFECDNQATPLGCAALNSNDHIIVYAHLRPYFSCRHDGPDNEAVVNLIYRRSYVHSGDLTYETWTLLTH